jgi:DNA repair exonuclease SbcCD ATPase subunit
MDLTTQSVKETQALIEEKMGVNSQILSRTMFHGQHSLNELLESTDGKLKDELSLVVPLGLWQNAATLVRAKSRQAGKAAAELNGMVTLRSEDVEKLFARRDQAEETVKSKQKQLGMLQAKFEAEMLEIEALVGQTGEVDFDELKTQLETVSSEIQGLDDRYKKLLTQRDSDLNPLQRSFKELSNSLNSLIERYSLDEREVFVATLKVDNAKEKMKQLEQKWSVDLSEGRPEVFVTPDTCPTCLQPIEYYSEGEGHSHSDLHRIGEKEIEEVIDALERAEAELETAAKELSECDESRLSREKTKLEMQVDIERASLRWNEELRKIEEGIQSRRREHANLSEKLSIVANKSQLIAKRDAARASINAGKTNVEFANVLLTGLEGEIREGEDRLNRLKTKMEEQNKFGRTMSDLAERFGQRGVQTFVLQNVVEALQVISQTYLDDLSDGAQRLQLSLDAGDRISRTAFVCGSDGEYKERPLSNLSGGQWRRCSLALTFGFAELVARQGKLRPSICILDEPLTHLDRSGRAKVGEVIRRMLRPAEDAGFQGFGGLGMSTVLLILQDLAAEELDEAFDCIDEVVKEKSESYINVDELS